MMIALRRIVWISVATAVVLAAASADAQTADAVDEALKKGDIAEAKTQLEQTVKRNPADHNAALLYASTLPPKEALKIADSISRAQKTPGWAKARALRISGDHLFLKEEYKKAADAYLQASLLDSASIYKHLYALSIAMDGRTGAARVVWNEIALEKNNEFSAEAARLSALMPKPIPTAADTETVKLPVVAQVVIHQPNTQGQTAAAPAPVVNTQNNTQVSTKTNTNAVKIVVDTETVALPVVAQVVIRQPDTQKQTAATTVNTQNNTQVSTTTNTNAAKADSVKTPSTKTEPVTPAPVNQQNNTVKADSVKAQPAKTTPVTTPPAAKADSAKTPPTKTEPVTPAPAAPANPKPTGPVFTIQVGAFASKDNADNLVKRLTGKYDDITVSTTGSGDQTLYRVRVGTFQKKEDATAYADRLIIEAGLSARVTEK
jgi:cell division septation protein DedD